MDIKKVFYVILGIAVFTVIFILIKNYFNKQKFIKEVGNNVPLTWDNETNDTIATLHPVLRKKAADFVNDLDKNYNIKYRIYSGLRSFNEQQTLYNQGRSTPGNIVTNAEPGHSYHNYGLAFDGAEVINGKINFNGPNTAKIVEVAKKYGLSWGGYFSRLKDTPHFELTIFGTPTKLLSLYNENKVTNGYINLT